MVDRAKTMAEFHQRMKGRPVPTQAELDTIKLGGGTISKSPSGADPLPRHGLFGRLEPVNPPTTEPSKPEPPPEPPPGGGDSGGGGGGD